MASGYRSGGVDFDDLFDLYVEGQKSADTGRRVAGVDLSQRYAHISYGSKRADVGYRVAGVDVSNLWAAKGTARYSLPFDGRSFSSINRALTNSTGDASASILLTMSSDGTFTINRSVAGGGNGSNIVALSGGWLPAGDNVGQYEVLFEIAAGAGVTPNNAAPGWSSLSASRSASVTVTVPAASATDIDGTSTITCRLRKIGGNTSVSTFTANTQATGWY